MKCKMCGSEHYLITYDVRTKKQGKGCLYWLVIGWWLELLMWILLTIPMLLMTVFRVGNKTKVVSRKIAICQKCGHSWTLD